jgi:uncharacterized protein YeaO (DUF488 family)
MKVAIKRVYEPSADDDGYRILVDRLWPRGIKKETVKIDCWLKEVAPSTGLRKWFNHEPEKWIEFQRKYLLELKGQNAWEELQLLARRHKVLTLLFGAKDERHNHAVMLARLLNG